MRNKGKAGGKAYTLGKLLCHNGKEETVRQSFTLEYLQFHRVQILEGKIWSLADLKGSYRCVCLVTKGKKRNSRIKKRYTKHREQACKNHEKSSVQQHVRIQQQYVKKDARKGHLRLKAG